MIISGDFFTANHNNTHWRIWTGNLCHWLGEGSGDHHLCLDQQINQQEEQSNPNQRREIVWSSLQLLILKIICKNLDRKKEIQVKLEDYSDKETQFNLTFILDLITYGEGEVGGPIIQLLLESFVCSFKTHKICQAEVIWKLYHQVESYILFPETNWTFCASKL